MPWFWTNTIERPVAEYLYDYHLSRKANRFLYYCRECVRNFDTAERVATCPKCGQETVIELPKAVRLERKRGAKKKYGNVEFRRDLLKVQKELAIVFARLQFSLWRIKIAMYFILTSVPEELQ
jgi:DNA-directed RNA polymerase subunit RPC12/RpoP